MSTDWMNEHLDAIARILDRGDHDALHAFLDRLSGGEAARVLSRLPSDRQQQLLTTLHPDEAADLIGDVPEQQAVDLLETLDPGDAAVILSEVSSNDQADLIGSLAEDSAETILGEMSPEDAAELKRLASYERDVAGGLMITEYLAFVAGTSVREVLTSLENGSETYSDFDVQYIYVVSSDHVLLGVLPLRSLLMTSRGQPISAVMIDHPLSVADTATLDELQSFFVEHRLLAVPVLDSGSRMLGVVRQHDVDEALGERSDDGYLKSQGIVGGEEIRSMRLWRRATRRLSWLSVNILLNVVAASVIALYQDTLTSVIALAVFLPIISDMSGCSGSQAVAVSIRELTMGLITARDAAWVATKEVAVGVVNGIALGTLLGLVGWLWKGNPYLGLVVGAALAVNTVVAVLIGGLVPLLLKRFQFDPALASGPILTTITDVCGFFLLLSLASSMLPRLVG